ncbi:alpha-tocopherol transfer protein-like [Nymphalis io]|uniref:alpha-tocopherol transfer protein-like n=1 Tax=Inachis io TaxID=171585 RepID=UPI00216951BD|nr:alpha-tocopherol transfer protein-like [Nymphalis io]
MAKLGSFIMEMRIRSEYIFSDRYVIDCKHLKASLIPKLNPVIVKRSEIMSTEAYRVKVKGFHVINAPGFIEKIVYILKSVLKEKIMNRIYIHNSYEELYEAIPKEVLPQEYGGDLPSCSKLSEQLKNYLKTEEANEIIEHSSKIVSNETKRSCIRFNEEYLGMPGSFKRLNVD